MPFLNAWRNTREDCPLKGKYLLFKIQMPQNFTITSMPKSQPLAREEGNPLSGKGSPTPEKTRMHRRESCRGKMTAPNWARKGDTLLTSFQEWFQ